MAPIDPRNLSSNWKKLQQTLQSSKPSPSTAVSKSAPSKPSKENGRNLKRKRHSDATDVTVKGDRKRAVNSTGHTTPQKQAASAKRQKMDEPASVGASKKHEDHKTLSRPISMPDLRQQSLFLDSKPAIESVSVLAASPHHPDIENEGISETALPGKYIALDCEMVGIGPEPRRDSQLARVSMVNYHGHQVYDSYVLPVVPITDYRTAVSGIEERHMQPEIARPFEEVQADVKILFEGRILVGHGLKNDLDALILKHPRHMIRDTCKFSKFREISAIKGRTPALKHLVEQRLGVDIQVSHHSSVEDARATMALFRLEKPAFENEIVQWYGLPKTGSAEVQGAVEGANAKQKSKSKKKKKKKT